MVLAGHFMIYLYFFRMKFGYIAALLLIFCVSSQSFPSPCFPNCTEQIDEMLANSDWYQKYKPSSATRASSTYTDQVDKILEESDWYQKFKPSSATRSSSTYTEQVDKMLEESDWYQKYKPT